MDSIPPPSQEIIDKATYYIIEIIALFSEGTPIYLLIIFGSKEIFGAIAGRNNILEMHELEKSETFVIVFMGLMLFIHLILNGLREGNFAPWWVFLLLTLILTRNAWKDGFLELVREIVSFFRNKNNSNS